MNPKKFIPSKPHSFEEKEEWLKTCGGAYKQICNFVQEHIKIDGDWVWIQDKNTKEEIKASQFEILSKKYAVIFKSLGL